MPIITVAKAHALLNPRRHRRAEDATDAADREDQADHQRRGVHLILRDDNDDQRQPWDVRDARQHGNKANERLMPEPDKPLSNLCP